MQRGSSEGMHKADITAAIKRAGYTLEGLSQKHRLSKGAVSTALCKPWPKVEQIIAETIGIPAHLIWPPRYPGPAMPIKRGKAKVSSGSNSGRHVKKRVARRTSRAHA